MSPEPTPTSREAADALERGRHNLRNHVARSGETISYSLRNVSGESNNSCTLTWTPGTLTLSGDIGEVVLTHYSALRDFEGGLRWAERGAIEYLIGKSNLNEYVLDREATVTALIESANAEAGRALVERRAEANTNRRMERFGDAAWALDMEWWNITRVGYPPRLTDYLPEPDWREAPPPQFTKRLDSTTARLDLEAKWDIPDGWEQWFRIYTRFGPRMDPNRVFLASERAETRSELLYDITSRETSADDVAEICTHVDRGDFYGTYVRDPRSVYLISALRTAAAIILDTLAPQRTWGKTWGDPVV